MKKRNCNETNRGHGEESKQTSGSGKHASATPPHKSEETNETPQQRHATQQTIPPHLHLIPDTRVGACASTETATRASDGVRPGLWDREPGPEQDATSGPFAVSLRKQVRYWERLSRFMPITASGAFHSFVASTYPDACRDPGLWRLLGYLMRGWNHHRDSARLQLGYEIIAALDGRLTQRVLDRETYPATEERLGAIQRIIGPDEAGEWRFTWSRPYHGDRGRTGRPRMVRRLAWPTGVQDQIAAERLRNVWDAEPRMYWDPPPARSGTRTRHFDLSRYRAQTTRELQALADERRPASHPVGEVLPILDLLNSTNPHTLARLVRENSDRATALLNAVRDEETERARGMIGTAALAVERSAGEMWEQQSRCLEGAKTAPAPRYAVGTNTPRLFGISDHLTGLRPPVRRGLLRGLVEVDLSSCHLAALTRILDLPGVRAFLEDGHSIWDHLFDQLRLTGASEDASVRRRLKDGLKREGLYPALYGRNRNYVVRRVDDAVRTALLGTPYAGRSHRWGDWFVGGPLMAEILAARDTTLSRIGARGGIRDIDGRWIALPGHAGDIVLQGDASPRTALCYAASVVELKLMAAVTDLQREQQGRRFQILLWQHDGASLRIVDHRRTRPVLREVQAAVARRAEVLGVPTKLEVEPSTLAVLLGTEAEPRREAVSTDEPRHHLIASPTNQTNMSTYSTETKPTSKMKVDRFADRGCAAGKATARSKEALWGPHRVT